jgi:ATP-dependent Clp protease ATP-binding subunit ClpA
MVKKLIGAVTTTGLLAGGVALALVSPGVASAAGHQTIDTSDADTTVEDHGPEMRRRARPNLDTLSEVLGVDSETLGEALKGGQSIADLAAENNVSIDTVTQAMLDEQTERIAAALDEGRIDQERADAMTERLTDNIDAIVNGELRPGRGDMGRGGMRRGGPNLDTLSEVLGVDADTLGEALKGGQSIADLAAENNVSIDTVTQAMLDEQAARVAAALDEGRIDQERADAMTERLTDNIDAIVNGEMGPGQGGMGQRGMRQEQRQENLDEMAGLLGVESQDLADSLKAGSSLSDIAEENGVDTEVIVDAIVDRQTERLNTAVENGRVSEDRAAEIAENIEERATAVAAGERGPGHGRRGAPGQAPSN